jgi:hypothetical protein
MEGRASHWYAATMSHIDQKRTTYPQPKSTVVRCYSNSGQTRVRSVCPLCAIRVILHRSKAAGLSTSWPPQSTASRLLAPVAKSNAEYTSFLTQRARSPLHQLWNLCNGQFFFRVFAQLCKISFCPWCTLDTPLCFLSHKALQMIGSETTPHYLSRGMGKLLSEIPLFVRLPSVPIFLFLIVPVPIWLPGLTTERPLPFGWVLVEFRPSRNVFSNLDAWACVPMVALNAKVSVLAHAASIAMRNFMKFSLFVFNKQRCESIQPAGRPLSVVSPLATF